MYPGVDTLSYIYPRTFHVKPFIFNDPMTEHPVRTSKNECSADNSAGCIAILEPISSVVIRVPNLVELRRKEIQY